MKGCTTLASTFWNALEHHSVSSMHVHSSQAKYCYQSATAQTLYHDWIQTNLTYQEEQANASVREIKSLTLSAMILTSILSNLFAFCNNRKKQQNMMSEKVIVLEENREEIFSWLQSKEQIKSENQQKCKRWSQSTGFFTGNRWLKFCQRVNQSDPFLRNVDAQGNIKKSTTTLKHSQNSIDRITSANNLGFQFDPGQYHMTVQVQTKDHNEITYLKTS